MGVSGSARWQKMRSMKSTRSRSSDPSTACIRYLRFNVLRMLGTSPLMPQKNLVDITNELRGHPSFAMTRPMMASLSPPA